MNIDNLNTTQNQGNPKDYKFFKNADIPFDESKEEIWDKMSNKLEDIIIEKPKATLLSALWFKLMAAFVVVIGIGFIAFTQFYTTVIVAEKGVHVNHVFPDGSKVELNAASSITYQPYRWSTLREVQLTGEAFFSVKKGKPFIVVSENGTTEVLGTRFNINTRDNTYNVFCEEGKVKVSSGLTKQDFTIRSGEMALLQIVTGEGVVEEKTEDEVLSWKSNRFNFNGVSLVDVFENLEIQYDVKITDDVKNLADYTYTGRFNKTKSIEPTLEVICQSFNLNFTQLNAKEYKIILDK